VSTKQKKKPVLGHSGWPFVVIGRQATGVDRETTNHRIRLLYEAWTRAVTEVNRVVRLHEQKLATAGDVALARQNAEAAWRPYTNARANVIPPARSLATTSRSF
jgi:hypothetical protein